MKKNLQSKIISLLSKANLSKWIVLHLIGKEHSNLHRQITGIIIMIFGVGLTKLLGDLQMESIRLLGDVIGYGFHGIGLIPFINTIECVE